MAFWSVGDVVRKLREKRDWTQEQLADAAGVDKSTIVRLEDGGDQTKPPTLQAVAAALSVSVSRIYQIAEAIPEGVSPELLQSAARQTPEVQDKVTKVLRARKMDGRKARH